MLSPPGATVRRERRGFLYSAFSTFPLILDTKKSSRGNVTPRNEPAQARNQPAQAVDRAPSSRRTSAAMALSKLGIGDGEPAGQRTTPFSLNSNQPPGDAQNVVPFSRIVASSSGSAFVLPVRLKCAIKSLSL